MGFRKREAIELKSSGEFQAMRAAGLVVAHALQAVRTAALPGVTTAELDGVAHAVIREAGATPSFLGYQGFPAVVCTSVNEEVVHGIPGKRTLRAGDLLSVDCGAILAGWHGDAAMTIPIGQVADEVAALNAATEAALWAGLAQARAGQRLTDISHAIEASLEAAGGFGIVEEYGGHGIGSRMHMAPHVLNYGRPGRGPVLKAGMALAIEPMAVLGGADVTVLSDGWTVVTADRGWSAHWEHTVAVTSEGPWVLTALDEVRL